MLSCGSFPTMQREKVGNNIKNNTTWNKYTISNENLSIYTDLVLVLHVQGYKVIEVDMYI
jgi:hypothetical protein